MAAPCTPRVFGAIAVFASAFGRCAALTRPDAAGLPLQATASELPIDMQSSSEMCLSLDSRASEQKKRTKQRKQAYLMSGAKDPASEFAARTTTRARPPTNFTAGKNTAPATFNHSGMCELDNRTQYWYGKCPPGPYMSDAARKTREQRLIKALCAARTHGWTMSGIGNDPTHIKETNEHYKSRQYMTFESSLWPKLPACAAPPHAYWNKKHSSAPVYKPDFSPMGYGKLQCSKYSVHFLKSWKVASMTFPSYLECEYPACDWEEVPVTQPAQEKYTTLAAVRDPLARWVSAAGELLERAVNGICPNGPCGAEDGYVAGVSEGSTADKLSHQTTWYAHLKANRAAYSTEDMIALVKAMVADTRCNYHTYASEHFSTQSNFLTQNQGPAAPLSYLMKLESKEWGLALLSRHITGREPSGDCSLVPANVKECKPNGDKIPTEDDLLTVLGNDKELMKAICLIYAQDFVCFDYNLPPACQDLY